MSRIVLTPGVPGIVTFKLTGSAGTAADYSCQVSSAAINGTPNLNDVPATFCAPAAQVPAATSWELVLTFLQDWTDPDGLSFFLFDNDTAEADFSVSLVDALAPVATGTCRLVAGPYGGDAGVPAVGTVNLPCQDKPTITKPAATVAADEATFTPA